MTEAREKRSWPRVWLQRLDGMAPRLPGELPEGDPELDVEGETYVPLEEVSQKAVSEEAVEAVAERMYWHAAGSMHSGVDLAPGGERHWDTRPEQVKDSWRRDARRVLSPHLHPTPDPGLDPRKRGILREAMVLAFFHGAQFGKYEDWIALDPGSYPRDSEVVERVMGDAPSLSDLYPELARIADRSNLPDSSKAVGGGKRNSQAEQSDDKAVHHPPAVGGEAEVERPDDDCYLCLHCGAITKTDRWTLWMRDYDAEGGFRPFDREKDDDAWIQCPCCGERHGDSYECAGYTDGTRSSCEAEKASLLKSDPEFFVTALASTQPQESGDGGEEGR